jgi:hypothetical protein
MSKVKYLNLRQLLMFPLEQSAETKSVLRSIRVSCELSSSLRREARERRVSVNSLVVSILERYCEWDMTAEKFGFVQLSRGSFRAFLESLDENEIARVGRETGRTVSREIMEFWFKEVSINSLLRYLRLVSEYQKLFTLESTQHDGKLILVLHHAEGEKTSIWLLNFISETIKSNLKVGLAAEQAKNYVRFELPLGELDFPNGVSGEEIDNFPISR